MDIYLYWWEVFWNISASRCSKTEWAQGDDVASGFSITTKPTSALWLSKVQHYILQFSSTFWAGQEVVFFKPLLCPSLPLFVKVLCSYWRFCCVLTLVPRINSKIYINVQHALYSYCWHINIGTLLFWGIVIMITSKTLFWFTKLL